MRGKEIVWIRMLDGGGAMGIERWLIRHENEQYAAYEIHYYPSRAGIVYRVSQLTLNSGFGLP